MAAMLLAALTACGGGGSDGSSASKTKTPASQQEKVDCTSQTLDQAEWMEHCADEASPDSDTGAKSTGLQFGESYTWPDGLKVTVVDAKVFTDFNKDLLESPEPGSTDFRVTLKLENGSKEPVALDDLSLIVEGATNGGESAFTMFENGSQPLEGRLAPGVTATKNADHVLKTEYGKKIVVTVQRSSENFDLDFPEFTGEITG
ncbi:hypothetical protein [Streptomyces sp. JB150]|uniref:hypothetical protein n=1 Tax=Streptomyces sp. JB150 TaxID=2714844 RepID=UPI0019D04D5D|nr:hypothetical protein [Streptomyces sp. JB150]